MGGSIAIGHPFGATGARLVTTLANEMRRRGVQFGLISICAQGGMGLAMVLECLMSAFTLSTTDGIAIVTLDVPGRTGEHAWHTAWRGSSRSCSPGSRTTRRLGPWC